MNKLNKKIVALLITFIGSASASGWFLFKPTDFNPENYGTITFGVDAPYPPYEYFDESGQLTGFEIELGNTLCEHLELHCEWQVTSWDTIMPDLNAGQFDVIMSSMSITHDRKKQVSFSKPYYSTPSVFFARTGENIGGISTRNLAGKTVAVQRGTLQHDYLTEEYGDNIQVMALDGWKEISAAFRAADADIVFTDYQQWEEEFMLERVYEILDDPINLGNGVGLAFRKTDDELRHAMNEGLDYLKEYGEYRRIRRKYFLYEIVVN